MSAQSFDLRNPQLIKTVVVLLVLVATINVRVFLLDDSEARPTVRTQAPEGEELNNPDDLADVFQKAKGYLVDLEQKKTVGIDPRQPAADRRRILEAAAVSNPFTFLSGGPASQGVPAVQSPGTGRDEVVMASPRRPTGPFCQAVLLSGDRPTALIDGTPFHQGDRFDDYRVVSITDRGVELASPAGPLFLPAWSRPEQEVAYPVVTGQGAMSDRVGTGRGAAGEPHSERGISGSEAEPFRDKGDSR